MYTNREIRLRNPLWTPTYRSTFSLLMVPAEFRDGRQASCSTTVLDVIRTEK